MRRLRRINSILLAVLAVMAPLFSPAGDSNTVAEVKAEQGDAWNSVFVPSNQIPFHINLYMQKGLYYELVEDSDYQGNLYTHMFSQHRRLTGRLGAKVYLDAAFYRYTGTVSERETDFGVRKLRVNTYGRAFFLTPLTYGLEFGLADGAFYFNDGYVWLHEVPYVKSVKMGVFTAPMSLESLESSADIPMMETASAVSAFAPGDKLGIQIGGPVHGQRGTLYGGIFSDVVETETTAGSDKSYRMVARATWLPAVAAHSNSTPRLIHLGASTSINTSSDDQVQYRSRPESYMAPYLIDTGIIQSDASLILALEGAMQAGPLLLQSEFFSTYADDNSSDMHHFFGGYASLGLFLTGETRSYDRHDGVFGGINPTSNFSLKNPSGGALEWASRISYTDLDSGTVQGGTMGILSTGLNFYINPKDRILLDAGAVHVRNGSTDEILYMIQTRFQALF